MSAEPVTHLLNAYTWAGRRAECAVTAEYLNCTSDVSAVTCMDCLRMRLAKSEITAPKEGTT